MFPDPNNNPSLSFQTTVGFSVTHHIVVDLGSPIVDVGLRLHEVLRASVPEAAVDENSNTRFREDKISTTTEPFDRSAINEIPQSLMMQGATNPHFRAGVSAPVRTHGSPSMLR